MRMLYKIDCGEIMKAIPEDTYDRLTNKRDQGAEVRW